MSDVFHAMSSPVRRKILSMLKSRDMTAGEIAECLDVGKSTLSGHFNVLKAADLVSTSRSATTITYSLNVSVAEELIAMVATILSISKEEEDQSHD
ncbi:metalloregulator ArsR/SmtB family transcription factor [Kordiimonas pumila]|uniref:Metalloregulator ArsR/SmtB family transcription factor n=1 Tax=Kordiimonas pumila TaxID=2161677 RepID=A0ABV7D8E9_9PROT|nr:metalloregulator ArsR/SmtB family transcription factor [Kordiimonas pumila]